ncbi:MAG: hypothetical protein ACLTE2_01790 [Eubacteriales bacterium]
MVQQVASKIKSAAVFWLIWGILCAIIGIITVCVGAAASSSISGRLYRYYYDTDPGVGGIVYGSFLLVAAIINIIYAVIHFGYAKEIFRNPAAVLRKIDSSGLYITSIVLNIIFGGVIGIIGGIMMLNTRTLARGNQFVFQGGYVPQRPVTPYAPQQQPVASHQPPVQQTASCTTKSKCADGNQTKKLLLLQNRMRVKVQNRIINQNKPYRKETFFCLFSLFP